MQGFSFFLKARVDIMRRRQFVYNGQGLRHDGNYKLAARIIPAKFTVVIAFCGVDGSLMQPVVPKLTEDWPDIEAVLKPLLEDLKATRFDAGFSLEQTVPVFHSTDVYHKHKYKVEALYSKVWPEFRVQTESVTRKGDALSANIESVTAGRERGICTITGEPFHDIIALRKLVSPHKNDSRDFVFDHIELINRLSSEPPSAASFACPGPSAPAASGPNSQASSTPLESRTEPLMPTTARNTDGTVLTQAASESHLQLGSEAHELLRKAMTETSTGFQQTLRQEEHATAAHTLRSFLQDRRVLDSPSWKGIFKSVPPQGTIARIARRMDVKLHPHCGPYQWQSLNDFTKEVKRISRQLAAWPRYFSPHCPPPSPFPPKRRA